MHPTDRKLEGDSRRTARAFALSQSMRHLTEGRFRLPRDRQDSAVLRTTALEGTENEQGLPDSHGGAYLILVGTALFGYGSRGWRSNAGPITFDGESFPRDNVFHLPLSTAMLQFAEWARPSPNRVSMHW